MPPRSPAQTSGCISVCIQVLGVFGHFGNASGAPLRTSGARETARTVVPRVLVLVSVYERAMLPAFSQLPDVEFAAQHIFDR